MPDFLPLPDGVYTIGETSVPRELYFR